MSFDLVSRNTGVAVFDAHEQRSRIVRIPFVAAHEDYPAIVDFLGHQTRGYYPSPWSRLKGHFNKGKVYH